MSDKNMLWIRRETLEGIANAIRSKKGTTDLIPVPELETEILSIVAGDSSWCGEYVDGTIYKTGAIVSYEGNIYICIKDLDDMQDPTNAEYWEMLNEESEAEDIPEISEPLTLMASKEGAEEGELVVAYNLSEKVALPTGTNKQLGFLKDENFIPSNIKKGASIFGLTGAYGGEAPNLYGIDVTPTKEYQNIVPESGYDGFDEVTVNPIPSEYIIPSGTEEITANGTYDVADKASVTVAVEGEVIPEYTEVEDFTVLVEGLEGEVNIGYSVSEKVALPAGSPVQLATIDDENFIANNIKKGVNIFGLTGAYEAETVEEYDGSISIADLVSLITFTIGGTSYQAEAGMTWAEWCESDYNTDGYYSRGSDIHISDNTYITSVTTSTVIVSGNSYSHTVDSGAGIL